jgi:Mn2+/Fe2+ NRAMP family transporter
MSSSFNVYLIGFIVVVIGLAIGANLLGADPMWIGVGVVILIGIGILSAVKKTQAKTPPPS